MSKNLEPGMTIPDFELPDENGELTDYRSCRATRRSSCISAAASTARASASTTASSCTSTSSARSRSPSS